MDHHQSGVDLPLFFIKEHQHQEDDNDKVTTWYGSKRRSLQEAQAAAAAESAAAHQESPSPPPPLLVARPRNMAKGSERLPGTNTRLRTRDDGCCSVNFLKYVLHIYNVVLFLSGIVVGGIGVWTILAKHSYVSLMSTSTYPLLAYALVVAGSLAIVGSWLGCGGVTSENRCVILVYIFVVMGVFVLEAGVGALARLYEEQVGPELRMNLNRTFIETYSLKSKETAAIDKMQLEFKCCGAMRFEDWLSSEWFKDQEVQRNGSLVPDSCCKTPSYLCGKRDHPSNIQYTGCIYKFLETTKDHLIILGAVGLGLCVLEVFGIVLGSCLYIKLRHEFDD